MTPSPTDRKFAPGDYALLTLLALLLFGYCLFSGKALTMHEARLPECAREMMASGEWLLPHSGERPWLERPPFPHWVELITGHIFGHLDKVWIVRLPSALMGLLTLLLVASVATRLFGRQIGLLSGIALATMYEFYFYAGQAEDDIYLAFLVAVCFALFAAIEFPRCGALDPHNGAPLDTRRHFLGNRPWTVWAFFIVLGMTSLAKGPLVGAIEVVAATGSFLLLSWREKRPFPWRQLRLFRYIWLWGWILFAAITVSWSYYAWRQYPSLWDNYKYDFTGPFGHEPFWYYFICILWTTAPWTPVWILGLVFIWRTRNDDPQAKRFLLCWAIAPLLAVSAPARKHHHYLVAILPAYAVLAAFGLRQLDDLLRRSAKKWGSTLCGALCIGLPGLAAFVTLAILHKIPGPLWTSIAMGIVFFGMVTSMAYGLEKKNGRTVLTAFIAGFVIIAAWGQSVLAKWDEGHSGDIEFIHRVPSDVAAGTPLIIDAYGSLDFFRFQFYLKPDTLLIHNVTYLRDQRITAPQVYVISPYSNRSFLSTLGDWTVVDQSRRARHEQSPEERYTLFLLTFRPGLKRYPAPPINVLQALYRGVGDQAGPFCGPPPEGISGHGPME